MGSEEKRSQGQSTVGGGGGMSEQPKIGGRVSGGGITGAELWQHAEFEKSIRNHSGRCQVGSPEFKTSQGWRKQYGNLQGLCGTLGLECDWMRYDQGSVGADLRVCPC